MIADVLVGQRQLVGITVRLQDASWYAKYAIPFFDSKWRVQFLLFDVLGDVPRMWQASAVLAGKDLRIAAKAEDVPRIISRGRILCPQSREAACAGNEPARMRRMRHRRIS